MNTERVFDEKAFDTVLKDLLQGSKPNIDNIPLMRVFFGKGAESRQPEMDELQHKLDTMYEDIKSFRQAEINKLKKDRAELMDIVRIWLEGNFKFYNMENQHFLDPDIIRKHQTIIARMEADK